MGGGAIGAITGSTDAVGGARSAVAVTVSATGGGAENVGRAGSEGVTPMGATVAASGDAIDSVVGGSENVVRVVSGTSDTTGAVSIAATCMISAST